MSQKNFGNRLLREVKRNKLKSAALGILLLVALYFWAPLLGRWSSGNATPGKHGAAPSPNMPAERPRASAEPTVAVAVAATQRRSHSWHDLVKWMNDDDQMTSASLAGDERNPFQPLTRKTFVGALDGRTPEDRSPHAIRQPKPKFAADKMQLDLKATLIGKHYRIADINGQQFEENEVVLIDALTGSLAGGVDDQLYAASDVIELKLESIQPRHVVFMYGDEPIRLEISEPRLPATSGFTLRRAEK